MAAAMLDRLLHRCHVVNIQGASYRMREYKAAHGRTEQIPGTAIGGKRLRCIGIDRASIQIGLQNLLSNVPLANLHRLMYLEGATTS